MLRWRRSRCICGSFDRVDLNWYQLVACCLVEVFLLSISLCFIFHSTTNSLTNDWNPASDGKPT
jgi:hypothetical protein